MTSGELGLTITFFSITVMGLIGNIFAFITILLYRHKNSLEHIMSMLAIADTMYLTSMFTEILLYVYRPSSCFNPGTLCYILLLIVLPSTATIFWRHGALVTVYLSLDRYLAIAKPLLFLRVCTPRIAKRVLGGISIVAAFSVCVKFIDLVKIPTRLVLILEIIELVVFYVIPVILMFVFNCLLIIAMCISRRTLTQLTTVQQCAASQISPTCKVIWVITVFLVTHVTTFVLTYVTFAEEIPMILNSSVNIFIYYATSQKFRKAITNWLCLCKESSSNTN